MGEVTVDRAGAGRARHRTGFGRRSARFSLLATAAIVVWSSIFLIVRANTDYTPSACNDGGAVQVSAICAAPAPSLLPAIPVATAVVLLVAVIVAFVGRRQAR